MVSNLNDDEPPISKGRLRVQQKTLSVSYIIPFLIVVVVAASNVAEVSSYNGNLSSFVALEPKTKTVAMKAIDPFTPFVEETKDAEPIVAADVTPTELVLNKPSLTKTERRPDEAPAEPVERHEIIEHTVAAGETLSVIAAKYDLKMGSIQVENGNLAKVDNLAIGDTLSIPAHDYDPSYIEKQLKTKAPVAVAKASAGERSVTVRGTSTARFESAGQPAFGRPAGSLGQNGYHGWAIDIPPSGGLGIYASASGVVVEVSGGWDGGYGNKVVIDHGSGWQTLYAHLADASVSPGQSVGKGAVIGVMGATGRVYPKGAVHLHFEIRHNGDKLNPMNFLQ